MKGLSDKTQAQINRDKYMIPPSIKIIDKVVGGLGIPEAHFEKFFGMYRGCISHVRAGFRPMPARFWHLFFEKITLEVTPRTSFQKKELSLDKSNTNSSKQDTQPHTSKSIQTTDPLLSKMIGNRSPK